MQCANTPFTLYTQSIPGATGYQWYIGATLVGTGTSFTHTFTTPGSYTVRVVMTYDGCTRESPDFEITVGAPPPPPVLSFDVLDCDPYKLELTATGAAGTYNWNNGMEGTTILVPNGGPYRVQLTDVNGCQAEGSIYAPKDPREYLWIFPTGCFCYMQPVSPYIPGPIIPFDGYAWVRNGSPHVTGSGYVPDYTVTAGNVYNLQLNNGYCNVSSEEMYFMSEICATLPPSFAREGMETMSGFIDIGSTEPALLLQPNPARNETTVQYRFATEGIGTIELFDVVGRRLQVHEVSTINGKLLLNLDNYAAGMYQVVLRQNGKQIAQAKLSLTH
jgi:hypothetical protein